MLSRRNRLAVPFPHSRVQKLNGRNLAIRASGEGRNRTSVLVRTNGPNEEGGSGNGAIYRSSEMGSAFLEKTFHQRTRVRFKQQSEFRGWSAGRALGARD